ncbi:MAG: HXXEE domain-containing protein [Anaerovoracaceae bacterium]
MKKGSFRVRFTKGWLSCWLYVIIGIAGVIFGLTVANWNKWDPQTRIYALSAVLLPLHVMEEWHFPGGFHTMYNMMAGTDPKKADRYPMNQLSDMWTNFIGVIFSCAVLVTGVRPLFLLMELFICFAEIYGHTSGGIFLYRRFKDKGKKTIYSPGFATMILGYVPVAIAIIISFFTVKAPEIWEIVLAIPCSMGLGFLSLPFTEKICRDEDTPYGYTWGNGYLARFLGK